MKRSDADVKKPNRFSPKRLNMVYEGRGDQVSLEGFAANYQEQRNDVNRALQCFEEDEYEFHTSPPSEEDEVTFADEVGRRLEALETADVIDDEPEESERLQAFLQDQNRAGPKPTFSSNRFPIKTGVVLPQKRSTPPNGVCFNMLNTDTCEQHKLGRCNYNHSPEAMAAEWAVREENARQKKEKWSKSRSST
jgi:hypothetical protein